LIPRHFIPRSESNVKLSLGDAGAGDRSVGDGPETRAGWTVPRLSLATLIVLAIGFRVPAMFLLRYGGSPDWSDFRYYHEMATLAAQGFYPDIHFWVEYPPIFPWLAVGAYRLSLILPPGPQPYFWFDLELAGVLAIADAATIFAIDRLGDAFWGKPFGRRSATLYAALFLPTFAILGWFDTLPTALLLLALLGIVARRPTVGGVLAGVGVMVKLFPLVALPAALVVSRPGAKGRGRWIDAGLTIGAAIVATLLIAVPFYLRGGAMFLATFQNVFSRGSWESPWALLDGYYGTGTVASLPDRLFYLPSAVWGTPSHSAIPWDVAAVVVAALFLWRLTAAIRVGTPRAAIALTGFGITLLLLLSKGFSIQFTEWLLPFIALLLPDTTGAVLAILLIVDDLVVEGYLYVTLFPDLHPLLWLSVGIRTVLLFWLAVETGAAIDPEVTRRWISLRRRLAAPAAAAGLLALVVAGVALSPRLLAASLAKSGDAPLLAAIDRDPNAALLFTQPSLYDRLYYSEHYHPMAVLAQPKLPTWTGDRSLNATLQRAVGSRDTVILVTDTTEAPSPLLPVIQTWLSARYGAEPEQKINVDRVVVYRTSLKPAERALNDHFGSAIALVGVTPPSLAARAGGTLTVTLHWHALSRPPKDYTASLQLLSPQGKLVTQRDAMPMNNTLPTTDWQPGQDVYDPMTLTLPANLPDGSYPIIVVLYDHVTGQRLSVGGTDHAVIGTVQLGQG